MTYDVGSQPGQVLVLDVIVPEQPQGRVDERVVYVATNRDGRVDLAQLYNRVSPPNRQIHQPIDSPALETP